VPDESLNEIIAFYTQTDEASRPETGSSQLEFERTKELVRRFLPRAPARVLDMGGGSGPYAFWMAGLGYEVHLADRTPRLVDLARRHHYSSPRLASMTVGDARRLAFAEASVDAVRLDEHIVDLRHRVVADGQYRNDTGDPRYFVTAYFHRPSDFQQELAESRFDAVEVFGIEGPGWLLPGVSAHLLGVGRRP